MMSLNLFFNLADPSTRNMALGFTQHLTEMSAKEQKKKVPGDPSAAGA
jgi:hypothetical protein